MTVKELIAKLKKLPSDALVIQNDYSLPQGLCELRNIASVRAVYEDGHYRFARSRERKNVVECVVV